MDIRIKTNAAIETYETQARICYARNREDYAKLLRQINDGTSLRDIFPSEPIVKSVFNKLQHDGFVDSSCRITALGYAFLEDPKLSETEEGIFSVSVARVGDGIYEVPIVPMIRRKLSSDTLAKKQVTFPSVVQDVEFQLDESNGCYLRSISLGPEGWAYMGQGMRKPVTLHVNDGTYSYNEKKLSMGSSLKEKVLEHAQTIVSNRFPYTSLTDECRLVVRNASDFALNDILSGTCSLLCDAIELENVPLLITSIDAAYQYTYLCLYDLLMKGNYYSLSEMNEIVQNEIITKPIIDDQIKVQLASLTISKEGFKQHLDQKRYEQLEYRLRIVDEYLGIQSIVEDASYSTVRDYWGLLDYLSSNVAPSEVKRLYLVMGYAFVKRADNRILDCLNVLKTAYPNISIVNKKGRSAVEEEPGLRDRIAKMGVSIVDKVGLGDRYHDRYLVFEKFNAAPTVFVSGPEIGQLFHHGETKGQIYRVPLIDTNKGGKSLFEVIKE